MFAVVLMTLAMAAESPKAIKPTPNPVVTKPDWIQRPSGDDVSLYYPARALEERVSAKVKLRCEVKADGYLTGCAVIEEEPKEYDFGVAAILLSSKFRMKPQTVDGMPVGGATVIIPISFTPPDEGGDFEGMPSLSQSLACYGYYAARSSVEPDNSDVRAGATIFGMASLVGAQMEGWSVTRVESAMSAARQTADTSARPVDCAMPEGAAEAFSKPQK